MLSLQRYELHTKSGFWIMSLAPAQVFGPSCSPDLGQGEMQTPRLNRPSKEPVSSLTRDGTGVDVASQVASRGDNPSLTGYVAPRDTSKKAQKASKPGKKSFPLSQTQFNWYFLAFCLAY